MTRPTLIALSIWLLTACAARAPHPRTPPEPPPAPDIVMEAPSSEDDATKPSALPEALVMQLADGHYAMAEKIAIAQLATHPDDPWLLANLGLARLRLGRPQAAVEALESAQEDPALARDPRLLNELGMAYRRLGRFDEAERTYRRAIELAPDYAPAWRNLGILLELYLQRPDEAIPPYRRYIELTGPGTTDVDHWIVDIEHRLAAAPPSGDTQ